MKHSNSNTRPAEASENSREAIISRQMTYKDYADHFAVSRDDAVEVFRELDLKKCSSKEKCVSIDGPIQSRLNFCKNRGQNDGLSNECKYCKKVYQSNWYGLNKEYRKKYNNQYRQNNKEYCNQKSLEHTSSYTKFNKYTKNLSYAEITRRDPNNRELLQVKCAYCNRWFNPIVKQVRSRKKALNGGSSPGAENRFYCSEECKQSCPIYNQRNYSKDDPRYLDALGTSREVQPELRQMVFERDGWECQRCKEHKEDLPTGVSLHCHHIEGVRHEPIESADINMCMTVCSECHKNIHKIPGCTYNDMKCTVEEVYG